MYNKKVILTTVGIVILLAAIVYVCSRISPLIGNYSVEKNEKKVEAKPTMDTKSQETKLKTTKPQATKKPKTKKKTIFRFATEKWFQPPKKSVLMKKCSGLIVNMRDKKM